MLNAALSSTMMLVLENGRAFRKNRIVGLGRRSEAVRLAHRSRWQKAAGQREKLLQLALTMSKIVVPWSIIPRAFHYVNSHPRGDPVYSLLNDMTHI